MKRALGLTFILAACLVGFLSVRGAMPFMPVFGSSMEPALHGGNLLMIEPVTSASDVAVGDIIVYDVPRMIREYHHYPPIVAHRVVEVITQPVPGFRTAGDNTGEDPFTVHPQDLRGTVGGQIPYLGLPLLLFRSQGMIFVIAALALLTYFLYGNEINRGRRKFHRKILAPVIDEERRVSWLLTRKIESTEKKIDATEQALGKFSAAIELYAQHLSSHTSAIQGLSEASQELKRGAAEQNRVLMLLTETAVKPRLKVRELTSRAEQAASQIEELTSSLGKPAPDTVKPALHGKKPVTGEVKPAPQARPVHDAEKPAPGAETAFPQAGKKPYPPGCARSRPPFTH